MRAFTPFAHDCQLAFTRYIIVRKIGVIFIFSFFPNFLAIFLPLFQIIQSFATKNRAIREEKSSSSHL